jgi:thiol-disulfide isomerase/thioredoxin
VSEAAGEDTFSGRLVVGGLVGLMLLGVVVLGVMEGRRGRPMGDGEVAPAFELERFRGGTVSLDALKGKVVMLDFWATWCGPCRAEMPALLKLAREYESKGVVFVAANRDDPYDARSQVASFAQQRVPGLEEYVAFADDVTSARYRITSLPTLYFIDRQGKVLDAFTGSASESQLRRWIEEALKQSP